MQCQISDVSKPIINIVSAIFRFQAEVSTRVSIPVTEGIDLNPVEDSDAGSIISEEAYEQFSFITNVIVTPAICAVGLSANCFGIGVLYRASALDKLAIYTYLCSLTMLDGIFLFSGLIRGIPDWIRVYDKYLANAIEQHANQGVIYVDMILTYTVTSVIVVIAVERLMALTRPFTVKNSVLAKHPKKIVFLCFLLNAIFLIPFPVNFEVSSFQNMENRTEYYLRYKLYAIKFMDEYNLVHTVVHNLIPSMVLLVVNIAIPVSFARIRQRRAALKTSSSDAGKQTKITLAVFVLTVLYFLFTIPDTFIKTRAYFDKDYSFSGKYKLSFWFFVDISNLFSYLNAANDFIIYILVSDHYRRIFKQVYCKCIKTTEESSDMKSSFSAKSTISKITVT